jgi:hypothetical protein
VEEGEIHWSNCRRADLRRAKSPVHTGALLTAR